DATFVRNTKVSERLIRVTHRVPVRLTAHDHRYEWIRFGFASICFFRHRLFSLVQRKTALAVECVESFSFDEVVSRAGNPAEQSNELCMCDFAAATFRQE